MTFPRRTRITFQRFVAQIEYSRSGQWRTGRLRACNVGPRKMRQSGKPD